jgi:cellulose synthase operon protein B
MIAGRSWLAVLIGLSIGCADAFGADGPALFDMSTEQSAPAPDRPSPSGRSPDSAIPAAEAPPAPSVSLAEGGAPEGTDRPILPYASLKLTGELDARAWTVNLTRAEAESPATLTIGYKAAVVVAPESSRLRVSVNDRVALDNPISASDHDGRLSVRLPAGLLRAGANLFRIEADQRHRTDCTIASTYELWTEIYNGASALHFPSASAGILRRMEDLGATSVDQRGVAHIRIVAPGLGQAAMTDSVLRLAQRTALLIGEPNQTIAVGDKASGASGAGVLTAVIGTAADLQTILQSAPPGSAAGPLVAFVNDPVLGPSTLVVSGPTPLAVSQAVESIAGPAEASLAEPRQTLATSRWFAPDAPLLVGSASRRFSELGIHTQEFTGRRFRTQFIVGLPSDFYASAYGEATILLDAAYSGEVTPGSHLDVYVNDHITATTPITTMGGAILRHMPIRILMTQFKPGPNVITFEAQLNVAADQDCRVGGGAGKTSRFVLFDTSEFVMPDFARIARLPDLAALMGTGFPYNRAQNPTALVMNAADADVVSAAATLLARMAVVAGRIIPTELASTAAKDRNAIFVVPAAQAPIDVLTQLGVDEGLRTTWKEPAGDLGDDDASQPANAPGADAQAAPEISPPNEVDTQATFDRWRDALSNGGGWRGNVSALQDWFQRTFQFSGASLRFLPSADEAFQTPRGATALLAQAVSPSGDRAWTLLTAPSSRLLRLGANALTAQQQWSQLAGHVVTYSAKTAAIATQPVATFSFVVTQPLSLGNLRFIAANWLSDNILAFSVLLLSACVFLGLVTSSFLSRIGRGSAK